MNWDALGRALLSWWLPQGSLSRYRSTLLLEPLVALQGSIHFVHVIWASKNLRIAGKAASHRRSEAPRELSPARMVRARRSTYYGCLGSWLFRRWSIDTIVGHWPSTLLSTHNTIFLRFDFLHVEGVTKWCTLASQVYGDLALIILFYVLRRLTFKGSSFASKSQIRINIELSHINWENFFVILWFGIFANLWLTALKWVLMWGLWAHLKCHINWVKLVAIKDSTLISSKIIVRWRFGSTFSGAASLAHTIDWISIRLFCSVLKRTSFNIFLGAKSVGCALNPDVGSCIFQAHGCHFLLILLLLI